MDPVTTVHYATVCAVLSTLATRAGTLPAQLAIGAATELGAAAVLTVVPGAAEL